MRVYTIYKRLVKKFAGVTSMGIINTNVLELRYNDPVASKWHGMLQYIKY